MTEKRFSYEEVNFCNDNITGNQFDLTNPNEMLDLLNSFADENEQLKLQYKELEISLLNNQLAYNDLEKENEQLKSELVEIKRQEQEVIEYLRAYHNGDVKELKE